MLRRARLGSRRNIGVVYHGWECPSVNSPPLKIKTPRMSGPPAVRPALNAQTDVASAPERQARKSRKRPALWIGQTDRARSLLRDRRAQPLNRRSPWACRYRPYRRSRGRVSASRQRLANAAELSPTRMSRREIRAGRRRPALWVVADALTTCEPRLGRGEHRAAPRMCLTSSGLICGVCSPAFAE